MSFTKKKYFQYKDFRYTEATAVRLLRELVDALNYLKEMKSRHHDIKPQNILVYDLFEMMNKEDMDLLDIQMSEDDQSRFHFKFSDFGVSKLNDMSIIKLSTVQGTTIYMAPEMLDKHEVTDSEYDFKADLWSLAVSVISICTLKEPTNKEYIEAAEKDELPHQTEFGEHYPSLVPIMLGLLVIDPNSRWSLKKLTQ